MRKKILGILVVSIVAIIASYNIYMIQDDVELSVLALANIEALADNGETVNSYHLFPCLSSSGNECKFKKDPNRPECSSASYCN